MYRELFEESGLGPLKLLRKLGVHRYYKEFIRSQVERHDFLLLAPNHTPDQWSHRVTGGDGDIKCIFSYRWLQKDEFDLLSDELTTFVTLEHIPELFNGKTPRSSHK
ncbi:MAG: hypothetical protein F4Y38_06730 [Gemmatimonadetes bacterium]|nr:hypothetical protein [Gemmatimonadota bacterium]MYG84428.1 hypothetical protein [Gemmatimonadota bacterium]MYJ88649.1 hypothetical protein [Gemmatimonadota bacterium]